jgi:hypothetical protein
MVSDYTITGKEKSMDITMTVSAEGGTYLESSYEFLGKVTGFKQSTYSYSRCFIGGKEITPKYSCPFTLRIVWKNPSTLHYINGALVQTKDFSPVVGMPIVSVKCSSWTTQSCSIDYISFDIEY